MRRKRTGSKKTIPLSGISAENRRLLDRYAQEWNAGGRSLLLKRRSDWSSECPRQMTRRKTAGPDSRLNLDWTSGSVELDHHRHASFGASGEDLDMLGSTVEKENTRSPVGRGPGLRDDRSGICP